MSTPIFVSKQTVPICIDGDDVPEEERNTIFILPKMPFGLWNKVRSAAYIAPVGTGKGVTFDTGAYSDALAVNNIVQWQGPLFVGVPCTPENILSLDEDHPLMERVIQELRERNPLGGETSPNSTKSPSGTGSGSRAQKAKAR